MYSKSRIIMFFWCVDSQDKFDTAKKNTSAEECKKGVQDDEASSDKQMFCYLHYVFGVSEKNILACKIGCRK